MRDEFADEIFEAFATFEFEKSVDISITPQFRPVDYGDLAGEITGSWATVVNEQGLNDVRAILKMPFSGRVLKQRLSDHEAALKRIIEESGREDRGAKEAQDVEKFFSEIITNLRAIVKQMPDGNADHMYCVASVTEAGTDQPVIQSDPPPDAKSAPSRRDLSKRISSALRARNPLLFKRRPARFTAARPIRNSFLRGVGRGLGQEAPGRVKGYLRSDR